jgi:hypothetical protein
MERGTEIDETSLGFIVGSTREQNDVPRVNVPVDDSATVDELQRIDGSLDET